MPLGAGLAALLLSASAASGCGTTADLTRGAGTGAEQRADLEGSGPEPVPEPACARLFGGLRTDLEAMGLLEGIGARRLGLGWMVGLIAVDLPLGAALDLALSGTLAAVRWLCADGSLPAPRAPGPEAP